MANVGATTVDDVGRAALAAVGSNTGLYNAIKWASNRFRQLSNRCQLKSLRVVDQLTIPAAITDGTVTTTRGSDIVAGDSDAEAAWISGLSTDNDDNAATDTDQRVVGRWFRFARVWYKVTNLEPDGSGGYQLRLSSPVTEASAEDTAYHLVQRHTRLRPDVRSLGRFVHQRLWKPLTDYSIDALDFENPERLYVTDTGPEIVAEIGNDEEGVRLVEFYPYPLNNTSILYTYYKRSPDLKPGTRLPAEIDTEALVQGVLVDVYRFEMAQALRENRVDAAAVWGNHLRTQEGVWERRLQEMMKANSANDDANVILHTRGPYVQGELTFIRTARQDALSRLSNFP